MTRYLIMYGNCANLVDDRKVNVRPDANVVEFVAEWWDAYEYHTCKTWGIPPEYVYTCTERTDAEAYIVYRESATGDFVYAGAVKAEIVKPAMSYGELQSLE